MPFTSILNEILAEIPQALGIIIVDFEGECVQLASKMNEHDLKVIGAYQVIHFGTIKEIHSTVETFITRSADMDIISMRLDSEYFISMVLKKGSLIGHAEYVLKNKLNHLKSLM